MKKFRILMGALALAVVFVFITSCKKEVDNNSNRVVSNEIENRGYVIKVIEYTGTPHEYIQPITGRHVIDCYPPFGQTHCITVVTCEETGGGERNDSSIKGKITIHEGGVVESGLPIEEELDVTIYEKDDKNQCVIFDVNK